MSYLIITDSSLDVYLCTLGPEARYASVSLSMFDRDLPPVGCVHLHDRRHECEKSRSVVYKLEHHEKCHVSGFHSALPLSAWSKRILQGGSKKDLGIV